MKKENPAKFTWERWGGRYFGLNEVITFDSKKEKHKLLDNIEPIGYVESNKLPVRPREKGISLLFKFKNEDNIYWIHCPKFGMEEIIKQVK